MGQITIRGINPDFERKIRTAASKSGKSLNRTVVEMLEQSVSKKEIQNQRLGESLLALAGGWDESDATEFLTAIQICEQVDEELWR
ncbi:MAG: hypothetical protein ABIL58_08595 [Pseudomonadota bacterium]